MNEKKDKHDSKNGARIPLSDCFTESFSRDGQSESCHRLFVSVRAKDNNKEDSVGPPTHVLIPIDNKPWYVTIGETKKGPMQARELDGAYSTGELCDDAIIWKEGMSSGVPLGSCKALIGLIVVLENNEAWIGEHAPEFVRSLFGVLKMRTTRAEKSVSSIGRSLLSYFGIRSAQKHTGSKMNPVQVTNDLDKTILEIRDEVDAVSRETKEALPATLNPGQFSLKVVADAEDHSPSSNFEDRVTTKLPKIIVTKQITEAPEQAETVNQPQSEETVGQVTEPPRTNTEAQDQVPHAEATAAEKETTEQVEETPLEQAAENAQETPPEESTEQVDETPLEQAAENAQETPPEESTEQHEASLKTGPAPEVCDTDSRIDTGNEPPEEIEINIQEYDGQDEQDLEISQIIIENDNSRMIRTFAEMKGIYSILEHDEASSFALDAAKKIVECEAARCFLFVPGENYMYVAATVGKIEPHDPKKKFFPKQGLLYHVTRNEGPVNIMDASDDERYEAEIDDIENFETKHALSIAIYNKGRILGVIELLNSIHDEGFSLNDAEILSYIAVTFGEHLDSALPERDAFRDSDFEIKAGTG